MATSARYNEIKTQLQQGGIAKQQSTDTQRSDRYNEIKRFLKRQGSFETAVNEEYVNSFIKDASAFVRQSEQDYKNLSYASATSSDAQAKRSAAIDDLTTRAGRVRTYLNTNKNRLTTESYNEAISFLNQFSKFQKQNINAFRNAEAYYSQWDSEDAYNADIAAYEAKEKEYQEKLNANTYALTGEISALKALRDEYNALNKRVSVVAPSEAQYETDRIREIALTYGNLDKVIAEKEQYLSDVEWIQKIQNITGADDFKEKSQYKSTANGKTRSTVDRMFNSYETADSGWDDPLYEYINGNDEAGSYLANQAMENWGAGGALSGIFGLATDSKKETQRMTKDEVAVFNYLYATEGKEAAHDYYDYLQSDLNARQRALDEKLWAGMAKEDPVGTSVFSVLASPLKGLSYIGQANDYILSGKVDQNAGYNRFSYTNSAIRDQVSKQIEESGNWGKAGSFLYQTGMSMGDFVMSTAVSGGNQALALAIMGTGAAADTTIAAKDRGLSDDQAFALGTIAGAAEIVMEKIGLDALFDTKLLSGSAIKYILKNALAEGGEEIGTDLINTLADVLVSQDKSQWQMAMDAYKADGKSENEAFGLALADKALELGLSGLGGALSGGALGGGGVILDRAGAIVNTVKNKVQSNAMVKDQYGGSQQQLVAAVLALDPGNAFALKMQGLLDKGKNLTGSQLNKLVQMNEAAIKQGTHGAEATQQSQAGEVSSVSNVDGAQDTALRTPSQPSEGQDGIRQNQSPTFQEEVQRQFERNNGYGKTAPKIYDVDKVFSAAQSAHSSGAISEERYSEIVDTLSFAQSDYAEGNITEAEYQGMLETAMRQVAQHPGRQMAPAVSATDPMVNVDRQTWQQAQRLAKALGRDIVFYSGVRGENGYYKDGTIYVNILADDPFAQVVSHELTHSLEGTRHYDRLKRFVFAQLAQKNIDIAQARKAKYEQYKSHGKELKGDTEIDAEIVAEYVQKYLLTDEQTIMDLAAAEPNVAKRIWNWLNNLTRRIVGDQASRERAKLEQITRIYGKALQESRDGNAGSGTVSMRSQAVAGGQTQSGDLRQSREQTEADYREGRISDEEYDAVMDEFDRAEEERLGRSLEKYSVGKTNRNVAKTTKSWYNRKHRKVFFDENVFPSYKVSQSEAHELAERWSRAEDTESGDCRLISYHGAWYRVQAFDDMDYGYQIMEKVAAKDYDSEVKRYGRIVEYGMVQREAREALARHRGSDSNGDAGYRTDYDGLEYRGESSAVRRVGANQDGGGQFEHDGEGSREGGRSDRTGESGFAVTSESQNGEKRFSFSGSRIFDGKNATYMDAVNRGDMKTARKMVDEAAKAAGYNSPLLYHGTRAFGYTEFDLSKMDDKRSIFLTDNERIASTYSGVVGRRDIYGGNTRSISDLTAAELVEELNSDQYGDGSEDGEKTKYTYMSAQDINDLIANVNSKLEGLQEKVPQMIRDYADRMASDFDGKDQRTHEQLVKLERMLQSWDYEHIPTQLYMLLHHTDAFNSSADEAKQTAKLEQDIRLMRKLSNRENFDGAIVESWLGGYSLNVLSEQQARDKLAVQRKTGNYGLYAKLDNPLVIEANGAAWNNIRRWSKSMDITRDSTLTEKRSDMYVLIDKATGNVIDEGSFAVNPYSSQMPAGIRHQYMVQKAVDCFSIITEGMNNTREIAAFAQKRGYDGVIFRNLKDNGGNNVNVGTEEMADIYVVFDPNHVKSADPVVYDDDGNMIPLSERFNEEKSDIRYSFSDTLAEEESRRAMEGSYTTDEVEMQARKKGYPVLHGEQIVPFRTWVRTVDRGNYGLVTGMAPENKLLVSFHNKHDGGTADNVPIAYENLVPVPGTYQMTKEEFASLMESEPMDPGSDQLSEEDMREIEELYNQARSGEDKAANPIDLEKLPKKAQNYLKRAQRKLLNSLCNTLGVPRSAMMEHLQSVVEDVTGEYLNTGTVSDGKLSELFDKAYEQGIVTDREFYDQYKHIKDHLRTTAVTLSEQDRSNIADFNDFRRRQFGRLRIVNQGGLPVDTAYGELQNMAPELFPETITHPADQLVQMSDVARSIEISQKTLDEYAGPERETFRSWAKHDFDVAVGEIMGDLHAVRRFADDRAARAAREPAPATPEEAMEAYKKLKNARRLYERVSSKNLLTQHDEAQVGRLLRHEIELEHLDPEKDNVNGITAVYEAKAEYERLCKLISEYKRHLHGKLRDQADQYLKTANDWKDKKVGIAYARETMRRNIYDVVTDRSLAREINDVYFEPVHDAEAKAVRLKDEYRNKVRKMNLSRKVASGNLVSEAHAVQLLGEAMDNIRILENTRGRMQHRDGKTLADWRGVVMKLWSENPNLNQEKIQDAVQQFRQIYDNLFVQMNKVRVENGYEPINYRSGYFPHFQPGEADGILAQFGRAMGIDTQVVALPTTITGLTHTFKPGIQWFGNAQERLGFNTAYDAVEGFDKYIEGAASVIYQTENIQRLRALATQVRYRTSNEGIQEQVDAVYEDNRLTDEEKQVKIASIYEHGKFALANFVAELDEYTNLLANKKSKYDRTVEALMGRKVYAFLKWWESRVGANMIAGNLSSALTNFIPLTQAGAQMDSFAILNGMWKTLSSYKIDDGLQGASSFLTNRKGSDPLVQNWSQKVSGKLSIPMEAIDQFVSGSIVRGAYHQNLKRGMSDAEAMYQADIFAAGVMADRSKGSMPTLMQASNPLFKMFTQFQLEVNNQFSEVFKDLPRNHMQQGIIHFAWVLFKYFLGAWLFNELYEWLIGRRPALDPIGLLIDAGKDFADPDVGFGEGMKNLGTNVLSELPFSSGLTLLGIETDGGRIPASSAVPDLTAIWDAATAEDMHWKKRLKEIGDEVSKPLTYVVPPFGGNQASKIWKGTKAFIEGGSYSVDAQGNDILQYPVYNDDPWSALGSLFRTTLFGKSSLPEAQDWVESGFDSLGAKETAVYQDMIDDGIPQRAAFELIQQMGAAKRTDSMTADEAKRNILRNSKVADEGKTVAYYGLLASDKERGIMDTLAEMGADTWEATKTLMAMKDARKLEGTEITKAKYDAIIQAALTDEEKAVLVGAVVGTDLETEKGNLTQYAKFKIAVEGGMSVDEYLQFRKAGGDIDDYLDFSNAGLNTDDAVEISLALDELVPLAGEERVSEIQRWRTCVNTFSHAASQLAALAGVMTEQQYAKVGIAYDYAVSPTVYVTLRETLVKYDANGNGSLSSSEVTAAINSMRGLSAKQKAVLWQLSVSSNSAKNNPYSPEIGQRVLDELNND